MSIFIIMSALSTVVLIIVNVATTEGKQHTEYTFR